MEVASNGRDARVAVSGQVIIAARRTKCLGSRSAGWLRGWLKGRRQVRLFGRACARLAARGRWL